MYSDNSLCELFDGSKNLVIIELSLENAKEVFHDTIVIAISFSGHTLLNALFF